MKINKLFAFGVLLTTLLLCAPTAYAQDVVVSKPTKPTPTPKPTPSPTPTPKPKPTPSSTNPQRSVVYKFGKNEILVAGESFLSFKADKNHFTCIVQDTIANKTSLVMDGVKKFTADYISNWKGNDGYYYWNDCYIDAADYSKCIFTYKNGNSEYIYIEGKTYGPYRNDVNYRHSLNDGGEEDASFVEKGIYYFAHKDEETGNWIKNEYLYGEPIRREYSSYRYNRKDNFSPDTITSVNQRHKVTSEAFSSLIINGTKVSVISPSRTSDFERRCMTILDDGRCVAEYWGSKYSERSIFIVTGDKVKELGKGEWFNYRTLSIDKRNIADNENVLVGYYWGKDIYSITSPSNHTIETSILKNYVLVDNKEYGKGCAINMWYYKDVNSFVWTALEGNELAMYKYKL